MMADYFILKSIQLLKISNQRGSFDEIISKIKYAFKNY